MPCLFLDRTVNRAKVAPMGGDRVSDSKAEAASALRWWLESGVDVLVQEAPRNWLEPQPPSSSAEPEATPVALPEDLPAFREWLTAAPDAPLASARSRPVMPQGSEGAEVMLLCELPGREEAASGQPIGGEAWELMQRMLAAIGFTADQAYAANLACFFVPGMKLSQEQMNACAEAARRHVRLAKPKRLLLLGDMPARVLLGKPLLEARGHAQTLEGVRAVATFHPRFLLNNPSQKARAWSDLLLLMAESS